MVGKIVRAFYSLRRQIKNFSRFAVSLPLIAAAEPAYAQGSTANSTRATGEIHGRITTAANAPVTIATIDVIRVGATVPDARATSTADGSFRATGLRNGRYLVRVRALGFLPKELPDIELSTSRTNVDLGAIVLTDAPAELTAMVVAAQKKDVDLALDRNTFAVSAMATAKGGNALDVLRNIPSVDVDIDNVVSLRGNSGVVIQINGRPSPMKGSQLGTFLAQLSADVVEKVEIVPNPSAREDPTGAAGIINIVMRKKPDAGSSSAITLSGATTGHYDAGGNVGVQRGPLSLFGSYGFFRDNRPRTESIFRENRYLNTITYLEQSGRRSQFQHGHTATGTVGYDLGDHDELSLDLLLTTRVESEANDIQYRDLNTSGALTNLSDRLTEGSNSRFNVEATLAHKHRFATKGHSLSSEISIASDREAGPLSVTARRLTLAELQRGVASQESQRTLEHPQDAALRLDYVRPFGGVMRFESGYKGTIQRFHTTLDTDVLDTLSLAYKPDSTRVSNFNYDQIVNATYFMLIGQAGKLLLQGGVRLEHASTSFHLKTLNATFDNQYNSAFPSALAAYNIDDIHQIKLSYSTRIRRPDDTDVLDPTLFYQDPLNVSRGNPYLRPEYIRAFELGLQRSKDRLTVQVTQFWRHTKEAVRSIRTIDSLGVATRTYANVATSESYGGDFNVSLSGGSNSRLSGFAGGSVYRQVSNASNVDAALSTRAFGWRTQANISYRFSDQLDLQSIYSYTGAVRVEQGRNDARARFSIAARQKLWGARTSVTLRVIDPFRMSRERSTTIDPRFYQVSDRVQQIRGVLLSVNRNFGRPPKSDSKNLLDGQ